MVLNTLAAVPQPVTLESLFQAYTDCRRNKRNTLNALAFEADYESNLVALCDEINSGLYQPGRSIAFVIHKPVKREIFAASFRDRVVHHWLINQLNPFFEKAFIHDSYASRKGRGAHGVVADFLIINPLSTARSVGERVRVRGYKTN